MPELSQVKLQDQLNFLNTAVEQGVDAAVAVNGNVLTAAEAEALKSLSPDELRSLRDVNTKIAAARVPNLGELAEDGWTCVNVVC